MSLIGPQHIVATLFDCFDKSAAADLRAYLAENPGVGKWIIAADFCLHDKTRPNNVFAFTLIPYDDYFPELQAQIKGALPRDFKKTKSIDEAAKDFLSHNRRFHFAFVFDTPPEVFDNGPGSVPLAVARESLEQTVAGLTSHERSVESIDKVKRLKQSAQANAFNVELLADIYLLSYLFSFVTLALARERPTTRVGWFSDRDNMTTWAEGAVWVLGTENLHGLAEHFGIAIPKGSPDIALPTPNAGKDAMWFDEFIRPPDYIAGILAAWDLKSNLIPGENDKYSTLATEVIADSRNTAVFLLRYAGEFRSRRIGFNRNQALNE